MSILNNCGLKDLIENAKNDYRVIGLILYGSYAKDKQKNSSDIDICILRGNNERFSEFEYLHNLSSKYDITFLDQLPFVMQNRVFSEGQVLVNNDFKTFKKIKKRIQGEYRGAYYIREKHNKRLLDSL